MTTYDVAGHEVRTPVEIREARTWFSTFAVPYTAARDLIAYSGLEPAPLPGRRALASLGFVRYIDGDLGPYHEFVVALIVRRPGSDDRRDTGAFIHQLPVNQPFTCAAGRGIWGFPKFVTEIDIDEGRRRDVGTLHVDGALAVRLSIARGVPTRVPDTSLDAYSFADGVLRCTPWRLDGSGSRGRPGGVRVELGTGVIAGELRSLGFPRHALMGGSMRHVRMTFGDATVVEPGAPAAAGAR
ncbi:MAG: acetoacetate decarboxylase family protein [Actinomycetes bacterium]